MAELLEVSAVGETACAALRILAGNNPANQEAIQAADGIRALLATLQRHIKQQAVAHQAVAALRNLCTSPNIQSKIMKSRGLQNQSEKCTCHCRVS